MCEYYPRGNVEGQFAENVVRQEGATGVGVRRGVRVGWVLAVAVGMVLGEGGWWW